VVTCAGTGSIEEVRRQIRDRWDRAPACLGPARTWQSATPFILPLFMKKNRRAYGPEDQVRRSLAERGLPEPCEVTLLPRQECGNFLRFVRSRRKQSKAPPSTRPYAFRITFDRPLQGPLMLGYASHFGLGLFHAVPEPHAVSATATTRDTRS
jgi:CRISPR-associated protein Csb2